MHALRVDQCTYVAIVTQKTSYRVPYILHQSLTVSADDTSVCAVAQQVLTFHIDQIHDNIRGARPPFYMTI